MGVYYKFYHSISSICIYLSQLSLAYIFFHWMEVCASMCYTCRWVYKMGHPINSYKKHHSVNFQNTKNQIYTLCKEFNSEYTLWVVVLQLNTISQHIRDLLIICYINLHFTYLLTYILTKLVYTHLLKNTLSDENSHILNHMTQMHFHSKQLSHKQQFHKTLAEYRGWKILTEIYYSQAKWNLYNAGHKTDVNWIKTMP